MIRGLTALISYLLAQKKTQGYGLKCRRQEGEEGVLGYLLQMEGQEKVLGNVGKMSSSSHLALGYIPSSEGSGLASNM